MDRSASSAAPTGLSHQSPKGTALAASPSPCSSTPDPRTSAGCPCTQYHCNRRFPQHHDRHLCRASLARPLPIAVERLPLFGALIVTIIPFFHGAVRHLYATYIEGGGSTRVENWVVLIDYNLLFLGGGLFVALASCLQASRPFGIVFVGILAVDVVWGTLSRVGFGGTQAQKAELSWARINAVTVVVLLVFLLAEKALLHWHLGETEFRLFLLLVATVRTGADYYRNHSFYCPPYPTPHAIESDSVPSLPQTAG